MEKKEQRFLTVKAAAAGNRRDLLIALRDTVADEIDRGVPARELSSLTLRLLELVAELERIDAEAHGDQVGNAAETPDESW